MTALAVGFYVAVCLLILFAIRDARRDNADRREASSFLGRHQADVRWRQRQREIDESRRIGWRR